MSDPRPFDAVVSLCAYTQPVGWLVKEFRYAFADGPVEPEVYQQAELVADWAHKEWKSGSRVLIRCQAGLNRSGLITALVLIKEGQLFADVASNQQAVPVIEALYGLALECLQATDNAFVVSPVSRRCPPA